MRRSNSNIILYERKKNQMATEAAEIEIDQESSNEESPNKRKTAIFNNKKESIKIILEILAILFSGMFTIYSAIRTFWEHGKDIEILYTNIEGIKGDYNDILDIISELSSIAKEDHEIFLQLSSINTGEKVYNVIFKDIYGITTETIQNEEYLATPSWNESADAIACDVESNDIIYSAEDLYNTPIITSYLDKGNEVYFYGRFNENNQWNGKCILNVYNDNKLVSIFEGIYSDGDLFSYKRALRAENSWIVNDRIYQGNYNSGETWIYNRTTEFIKIVTPSTVKEKQILTVEQFLKSQGNELLSYYNGNTSNGVYNDNSGRAFLVTYFKNGEIKGTNDQRIIKTFYQGCFSNGTLKDETSDAWYITREANTTYMFYEGSFSNGTADRKKHKEFKNYIGYDFISQKLKEKGFEQYESEFWIEYEGKTE